MAFARRMRLASGHRTGRSKYNVAAAEVGRKTSKAQERYAELLALRAKAGEIWDLRTGKAVVPIVVSPDLCDPIRFTPDATYAERGGTRTVVDVKGGPISHDFPLRLKLFRWKYPEIRILLAKAKGKRWLEYVFEPHTPIDLRKLRTVEGWYPRTIRR